MDNELLLVLVTVTVGVASFPPAVVLAPPELGDLEEAQVAAAVPVQSPDGRTVVMRLPTGDANP